MDENRQVNLAGFCSPYYTILNNIFVSARDFKVPHSEIQCRDFRFALFHLPPAFQVFLRGGAKRDYLFGLRKRLRGVRAGYIITNMRWRLQRRNHYCGVFRRSGSRAQYPGKLRLPIVRAGSPEKRAVDGSLRILWSPCISFRESSRKIRREVEVITAGRLCACW